MPMEGGDCTHHGRDDQEGASKSGPERPLSLVLCNTHSRIFLHVVGIVGHSWRYLVSVPES